MNWGRLRNKWIHPVQMKVEVESPGISQRGLEKATRRPTTGFGVPPATVTLSSSSIFTMTVAESAEEREAAIHPESTGLRVGAGPSYFTRFKTFLRLENFDGYASTIWFCPSYVIDWGVGLAAIIVSKLYLETASPYQRDLSPYYNSSDYHWSLRSNQVSEEWLHHLAVTFPVSLLVLLTLLAYPRGGIHLLPMLHHSLLGLLTAHALSIVPTYLLKIWVGELRPDFFSRCAYSEDTKICKPLFHSPKLMENGRKSFPSGHSSTSFAGLTFLALWIAGRNGAYAIGGDGLRPAGPLQSRLLRVFVASIWLLLATWVSVTRIQDHRHHPRDVIAGSLIGISSALVGYLFYFPSPFNGSILGFTAGQPRLVYDHDTLPRKQTIRNHMTATIQDNVPVTDAV